MSLGTVQSVSVVTANGVSGRVINPTTKPAIVLSLGAITPQSVTATGAIIGSNIPASPGGTSAFLRADGTWASPGAVSSSSVFVLAEDYGVVANDGVDHSTELQDAHDAALAAGKPLLLPAGTILGCFDYDTNARVLGLGNALTTLKLPNGKNRDVVRSRNANSLFGTTSTSGSHDVELLDFTIDGNRANNTTGCGLAHYGAAPRFTGLRIKDAPEHGMRTDWYDSNRAFGFEGFYHDIRIDGSGKHGWWHEGPHDSHASDIVIIDSGKDAHNTYNHLHHVGAASTRFARVHAWCRATATNLPANALYEATDNGGSEFSNCHFEGAVCSGLIENQNNHFDGCYFYAASGGKTLHINGSDNKGSIRLGNKRSGGADVVGITLGDASNSPSGNDFTVTFVNQMAGLVDWTYSGGFNAIRGASYANPSVTTNIGTPEATDYVWISKWGGSDFGIYQTVTAHPVDQDVVRLGPNALALLDTTGTANTAIGKDALKTNVSSVRNTAVGSSALRFATGGNNTGFGATVLPSLTTGTANTAMGVFALNNATSGGSNAAFGYNVGTKVTSGGNNLILGPNVASVTLTTGSHNILIGTSNTVDTPATSTSNYLSIGGAIIGTNIGTTNELTTNGPLTVRGRLSKGSSFTVSRDGGGKISGLTHADGATITVNRTGGKISSLVEVINSLTRTKTVNRDGSGVFTGITVTEA